MKERKLEDKEKNVLCVSNSYTKKFFLNPEYNNIPENIKRELKIMCVLFTEDVGGVIELYFTEDGDVRIGTMKDKDDFDYDYIGSELKVNEMKKEKLELFESLKLYYRVVKLGISPEQAACELENDFGNDDE